MSIQKSRRYLQATQDRGTSRTLSLPALQLVPPPAWNRLRPTGPARRNGAPQHHSQQTGPSHGGPPGLRRYSPGEGPTWRPPRWAKGQAEMLARGLQRAGPSGEPPRPLPAGRRAPAPPPPPHSPAARPTSTPSPRLPPSPQGEGEGAGPPRAPPGGREDALQPWHRSGRSGRGLAARVPRGPGRSQVPGGGMRARVKPGDQAQGGRWEAGAPGPGGGPGPRPGRRQPGKRPGRALGLGPVVISSQAAPAELPLKCRAVQPPGRWQTQGSSGVQSKA